jgi:hypothetical protein
MTEAYSSFYLFEAFYKTRLSLVPENVHNQHDNENAVYYVI